MGERVQLRRDTAANWESVNPTLAHGEPALETDSKRSKVGDGVSAWNDLPYGGFSTSGSATVNDGVNYDNPTFEYGIDGYDLYNDGSVDTPVDGTDGMPSGFAIYADEENALIGDCSLKILKLVDDHQGNGAFFDFSIDRALTAKEMQLRFQYQTTVEYGNYEDGDMGVYIYDKDNNTLIPLSIKDIPASGGKPAEFYSTWISSDSQNYRLIWHVQTTNDLIWDMLLDNIQVGVKQDIVGDVGRWVNVLEQPGSTTADVPVNLMEPGLYRIEGYSTGVLDDSSAIISVSNTSSEVRGQTWTGGGSSTDFAEYRYRGSVQVGRFQGIASGAFTGLFIERVYFFKEIKNIKLATEMTEYASNDGSAGGTAGATYNAGMVYGKDGAAVPPANSTTGNAETRYLVQYKNAIQPTDTFDIEIWTPTEMKWIPIETALDFSITMRLSSARYGIGIDRDNASLASNEIYVTFGNAGRLITASSYGGYGATWSGVSAYKWRVRKTSGGNPAEQLPIVRCEYGGNSIKSLSDYSAPIIWPDVVEDPYNIYDPTTGIITFPYAGEYRIDGVFLSHTTTGWCTPALCETSGTIVKRSAGSVPPDSAGGYGLPFSIPYRAYAGEQKHIGHNRQISVTSSDPSQCWISIERVG